MIDNKGALYKLLDKLSFGPINPRHMAEWIDNRMVASGIKVQGVGECIVHLAGARTRDIVQVARRCYDRTSVRGRATIGI